MQKEGMSDCAPGLAPVQHLHFGIRFLRSPVSTCVPDDTAVLSRDNTLANIS